MTLELDMSFADTTSFTLNSRVTLRVASEIMDPISRVGLSEVLTDIVLRIKIYTNVHICITYLYVYEHLRLYCV